MKKQLLAIGVMTTVGLAGVTGMAIAGATNNSSQNDPMSSLVSALATKFNLKSADVQAVFDANRTQMQAQREQQVKDQIAQLVTDGKLTQAQADKINAKRTELEKSREAERTTMHDKDQSERKSAMDAKKTELDAWLKDNGIDAKYGYLLMGGGRGHGGPGGMRMGSKM